MYLKDKVAIVTGSAMGIGRAMAEGLASEGASIVIADVARADVAAKEMKDKGFKAIGVKGDVSSQQDTEKMAAETLKAFRRIDILVNNAGIYTSLIPGPFEKITVEEWRRVMDVNVLGMFLCCRAVIGEMRKNKSGRVINLSSGTPFKGIPYLLHYTTSKGAVVALTRALAKEVGADNILVNAIAPGFTLSDGVMASEIQLKHFREVSAKARTLVRDQYPQDLVGAVKFFAGPDSSFITGQTLVVDGGAYFH
ncbi:MAG: SDR family oxidoreductase [Thermodesulfobacteriota bacterium]|jgi:NAD(P)-dependent dehydrogenase (short-subunit alcohol dehydrogenase family)